MLLAKPLRHPPLDLFLIDQLAAISCFTTSADRFLYVDVVLDVLERGFLRKTVEQQSHFFFRLAHTPYSNARCVSSFPLPRRFPLLDERVQSLIRVVGLHELLQIEVFDLGEA
jgi:hypothetical protein